MGKCPRENHRAWHTLNFYADVIVPGPWWTTLTYYAPDLLSEGTRVKVPLGRTCRTGFVHSSYSFRSSDTYKTEKLRNISAVIDDTPVVPADIWELAKWAGNSFLCSMGEALSAMFPSPFLKGEAINVNNQFINPAELNKDSFFAEETKTVYKADLSERRDVYLENIADNSGSMLIFPEVRQARKFYEDLPDTLKGRSLLWPATGGKKLWDTWQSVYSGSCDILIGSQACIFAPMPTISAFILEDESNLSYRMARSPYFNLRSIIAKRSALLRSKLVLGGRLPSSRIFRQFHPQCQDLPKKERIHLIDMKMAPAPSVQGVETPFRISDKVLEETSRAVSSGKIGIWILDRKGYAGQIFCESCGYILSCKKCGGIMSWHSGKGVLKCYVCGNEETLPETCPHCKGNLLNGRRPGLEALVETAKSILPEKLPVVLWHAGYPATQKERKSAIASLSEGGVVVGSRAALALMDIITAGSVSWLDADTEAMKSFYNSRFNAFSMIWESIWRGIDFSSRHVVIQSRSPGINWQRTLLSGWDHFWELELPEREEYEFPPFGYLAEIDIPVKVRKCFEKMLVDSGYDFFQLTENDQMFWVKVNSLKNFRKRIESFFSINNSSKGYPKIRIWMD